MMRILLGMGRWMLIPRTSQKTKKEKEWLQSLSDGCISPSSFICPIVTVKTLDSSFKDNICFELNYHIDTSIVGSNVFDVYDHNHYIDVYGYNGKYGHNNITTVDLSWHWPILSSGKFEDTFEDIEHVQDISFLRPRTFSEKSPQPQSHLRTDVLSFHS